MLMRIDFNNVRRQQIDAYKRLVELLNRNLRPDGSVFLSCSDLEDVMSDMKHTVVAVALSHIPGDPEIADVLGDEKLPDFAPEDDS